MIEAAGPKGSHAYYNGRMEPLFLNFDKGDEHNLLGHDTDARDLTFEINDVAAF